MAKPSEKSPEMERDLENMSGRSTAIKGDKCVPPPFGCGGDATKFRDPLSQKEYTISGLCQICQNKVWG